MQHEQECCARALQAEEQRQQAAAARAKAIPEDEATARHQQAEETRRRTALAEKKSLFHLPTPPKCSTRATLALINNLGIVYHQYCSSSECAAISPSTTV